MFLLSLLCGQELLCCLQHWGCSSPELSTLGHSLPFPRIGSHVLLEQNPKCRNAVPAWHPFICCWSLLMLKNLGVCFCSVFIPRLSKLVSLFKNSQRSVIRNVGAFFFWSCLSLKQDKSSQNKCVHFEGFFCFFFLITVL